MRMMVKLDSIGLASRNDVKRLWMAGVVHMSAASWLTKLLSVAQRIVLARVLGSAGIGHIAVAKSVLSLVGIPAGGGVFTGVAKLMAESGDQRCELQLILGTTLRMNLVSSALTCMVIYALVTHTEIIHDATARGILPMLILFLPFVVLSRTFSACLQGMSRIRSLARTEIVTSILVSTAIVVGAWRWGVFGWAVGTVVGAVFSATILAYPLRRLLSFLWDRRVAYRMANIGVFAFAAQLLSVVIAQFDTLSISGILGDPSQTGIYNTAALTYQQMLFIPGAVLTVAFPRAARDRTCIEKLRKDYRELFSKLLVLVLCLSAVAFFGGPLLFRLLGDAFRAASGPFRILLLAFIARTLSMLGNTYLDALGRTDIHFYIVLVSTVVCVVLNLVLIPRHAIIGAAWATSVTMVLYLMICQIAVQVVFNRPELMR